MERQADIEALLSRVEEERGVRILYACESGSRAWGFASPDSDFDIRFFFQHPRRGYLGVNPPQDTIELPIVDDLDPGGWDVRKSVSLLGRSNGALLEWLHSPIVYREEEGFLARWRKAALDSLRPRALADHYRGLAKQMWLGKLQGDAVRAKDYLYGLRALACARWVLDKGTIPPVAFGEAKVMLSDEVRAELPALLAWKERSGEGETMARDAVLDGFLSEELPRIVEELGAMENEPVEGETIDRLYLDQLGLGWKEPAVASNGWNIQRVRERDFLLFDAVAGSHAFGTAVERSDEDRRGVFVAPLSVLGGLDELEQVSDEKGDEVYYELRRFGELLLKNNPNAMEMLAYPEDCLRFKHPAFDLLESKIFLSKLCGQTFAGYAMGQIRKARGLNKKIVNPQPKERKPLLEFCFVLEGQGTLSLVDWLGQRGFSMKQCGLVAARHAPQVYAIFHDPRGTLGYRGILSPKGDAALVCSSVPHEAEPVGWMTCNRDAFKAHCRDHREYWEWVELRNEERYLTNSEHGRGYDSKNLMHTLRLLDMAEEIATEGVIRVRRPNREFLLQVRRGEFAYEELVARAEEQLVRVEAAFEACELPERPDRDRVIDVLLEIREVF